jgi:hypothetical protein
VGNDTGVWRVRGARGCAWCGGRGWGAAGVGEGDRFGEVLSKSHPGLQIAHGLLRICLRVGSKQHDEGEGETGVRGMRMGR